MSRETGGLVNRAVIVSNSIGLTGCSCRRLSEQYLRDHSVLCLPGKALILVENLLKLN